jgi:hypothetical protein
VRDFPDRLRVADVLVDEEAGPRVLDNLVFVDAHAGLVARAPRQVHPRGVGGHVDGVDDRVHLLLGELAKGNGGLPGPAHEFVRVRSCRVRKIHGPDYCLSRPAGQ